MSTDDPDEFDNLPDAIAHWKASRPPRDVVPPKQPTLADSAELHALAEQGVHGPLTTTHLSDDGEVITVEHGDVTFGRPYFGNLLKEDNQDDDE